MKLHLVGLLLFAGAIAQAKPAPTPVRTPYPAPAAETLLQTLRKGHPRLLFNEAGFQGILKQVETSPEYKKWADSLIKDAAKICTEEPSKYEIPDGLRLLTTSRRVRDRVMTLALAYRLNHDRRFLERTWKELEAAAAFPDWNPKHFLDTAEMTAGFAMAYDWLFDAWTPAQKAILRTAITEKGIKPAFAAYQKKAFWTTTAFNWNQVCHGGISMGALALADEQPAMASEFLRLSIQNLPFAMSQYAPDGAWAEGPGYWNYATTYNVLFLASLESALGTDFGLSKIPGFSLCGTFPIYSAGPTGVLFNFADAGSQGVFHGSAPLFWLASKYQNPSFAAYQLSHAAQHPSPLDFLWGAPWVNRNPKMETLPCARNYRGTGVVFMRTRWNDPQATFVGFKAGQNGINHSNLDLGSFVLDALGVRWGLDLGKDDYNLPGYFNMQVQRWTYYRMRAEAHNTLLINPGAGPDQDLKASAPFVSFSETPQRSFAIADLTSAYVPAAIKVQRGILLETAGDVLVQDEIKTVSPAEVWWYFHTMAKVEIGADGTSAVLKQDGAQLRLTLTASQPARFEVRPAEPLPTSPHPLNQAENKDHHVLALHFLKAQDLRIAVRMSPVKDPAQPAPAAVGVIPLEEWK